MPTETIEVFYKYTNIDSAEGVPFYHKYIVYTDSNGDKFYARGGPAWFDDGKFLRIDTLHGSYTQGTLDWDDNADDPSEQIKSGSDLSADWQNIVSAIEDMDSEGWTYLPERNSNSVVDTALDRAGLPLPTLDDRAAGEYFSPGSDNILPASAQTPPLPQPMPDGFVDPLSAFGNAKTNGSPLVLDLDGDGIELTAFNAATTTTFFDIDGDGFAEQTAWVGADDGLLVRDINENGIINDVSELFGSSSIDGFAKLALLDDNGDSIIDQYDDAWSSLLVWQDANGDAVSQSSELYALGSLDIVSIDLAGVTASTSTINGNAISHTSTFRYDDGSTDAIVDAWFVYDDVNTFSTGDYLLDETLFLLPTLRGFGLLPDLHLSISVDSTLKSLLQSFVSDWSFDSWTDSAALDSAIETILYRWAGVDGVSPTSRGANVDGQHLEFLEELFGEEYLQVGYHPNPAIQGGEFLEAAYDMVFAQLKAQLLAQIGAQTLYDGDAAYNVFTGEIEGTFTLLESVIGDLETIASGTGVNAEAFWLEVAKFIDASKGIDNITTQEETWLDDAVTASDASLTWDDIVADMPDLSGAGYFEDIYGTAGADTITGTYINERIIDYAGDDTIAPGAGGDLVYDYAGNDTYQYTAGNDVYHDTYGSDVIELPSGITLNDLTFYRANDDSLFITVGTLGDIEIPQFFNGTTYQIETIEFSDTSTFDLTAITTLDAFGSEGDDGIQYEDGIDETIYGLGGDDDLWAYGGDDILDGGSGNDHLYGGDGDDTYIMSAGFDIFSDSESGYNVLVIPEGYTEDDVHFFKAGNDITVLVTGLGQATIGGQAVGSGYEIDEVYFAETDTSLAFSDAVIEYRGGDGNDNFTGTSYDDMFNGLGGDDVLSGGAGDDTYIFSEGSDVVSDGNSSTADRVLFWEGWSPGDIDVYRQSAYGAGTTADDLVIADHSGNKMIISDHFDVPAKSIEYIEFSDSTVWTISNMTIETWGTSGDDTLTTGDPSGSIYRGFAGNDTMSGYTGDDIFYHTSGLDTVNEAGGNDVLHLEGVTINDISVSDYSTYSVKVVIDSGVDEVTLNAFRQHTYNQVEKIAFDDGFSTDLTSYSSWLWGTTGNDTVSGGGSADTMIGKDGNDSMDGGAGDDHIHGGAGNDTVTGGTGNDLLYGGDGTDTLDYGSDGAGVTVDLAAGTATDGNSDTDTLDGFENVTGSAYADTLTGDGGANTLSGGNGNDVLTGGAGDDTLAGGGGTDTADYSDAAAGVTVSLLDGTADDGEGGSDTLTNIENVIGSAFADTITGSNAANILDGGAGDDLILGVGGNDTLYGGDGDDTLHGNGGTDTIDGGAGSDTVAYAFALFGITVSLTTGSATGDGPDTLVSIENVSGSLWADTITGNTGANILDGAAGNDNISGGDGNDTLKGGSGNDTLDGGNGTDTVDYSAAAAGVTVSLASGSASDDGDGGTDTLSNIENVIGSAFGDTITGSSVSNMLDGGDGDDFIFGQASADMIYGGAGDDFIQGNAGDDTIDGGDGIDTISYGFSGAVTVNLAAGTTTGDGSDTLSNIENVNGSAFADTITGNSAANALSGGGGADTIYGGAGDDRLSGAGGLDTLYGEDGADTFEFLAASAFSNIDVIKDYSTSDGDIIDLTDILGSVYDPQTDAITDFVEITDSGSDTVLKVDLDGTGGTYSLQQIATLEGITGLTDEAALETSGLLLAA